MRIIAVFQLVPEVVDVGRKSFAEPYGFFILKLTGYNRWNIKILINHQVTDNDIITKYNE